MGPLTCPRPKKTASTIARVRAACEAIGRVPEDLVWSNALVLCVGRDEAEANLVRCREILADGEDWRGIRGRLALAEAVVAALMADDRVLSGGQRKLLEMARALMAVRGYGVEVEEAFRHVLEMSDTTGTTATASSKDMRGPPSCRPSAPPGSRPPARRPTPPANARRRGGPSRVPPCASGCSRRNRPRWACST